MCFSNLPVEFDDEGNPYLAEEAEEVGRSSESDYGCREGTEDVALEEADPEALVDEILETMPESIRERLVDGGEDRGDGTGTPDDTHHRKPAGGD